MQKTVMVLGLSCALLLGACQGIVTPTLAPGPTVDAAGTSDAQFKTAIAETLTARPASSVVPATNTSVVPADSPTPPATVTPFPTPIPPVDLTDTGATATGDIPTATPAPDNTRVAGEVTAIWTLAIRKYGTQPPAVPFSQITLINKAKAEAYISLQVNMPDGKYSVIEYPVRGAIRIQAPVGSYLYVAWVGGNKMVGNFRLHQDDEFSILLYKDRVVIK